MTEQADVTQRPYRVPQCETLQAGPPGRVGRRVQVERTLVRLARQCRIDQRPARLRRRDRALGVAGNVDPVATSVEWIAGERHSAAQIAMVETVPVDLGASDVEPLQTFDQVRPSGRSRRNEGSHAIRCRAHIPQPCPAAPDAVRLRCSE